MSDETQEPSAEVAPTTPKEPEAPKKNKGGRPRKVAADASSVTLTQDQFGALMARIQNLEKEKSELAAGPEIEISTTLPNGQKVKPGTIVNISADPTKPDFRKAHWSRRDMEETYQMVTFKPEIDITVSPHGNTYELHRRQEVTVPSIVQEFHDAEVYRQDHLYDRYRPLTSAEKNYYNDLSTQNKGQPIWSRLEVLGGGLDMGEQAPEEPAKA